MVHNAAARKITPQLIAFYLPQYHPIPENDRFWGEGFTDWENVKQAKALFPGHDMPILPGEELGYYDLSDGAVLKKQAALAAEFGIAGFCFYHYWFGGKVLLEKPLESFLARPEIDIRFCLCWANEPWSRNWNGSDHEVLLEQKYGDRPTWETHFDWLARFLADPRALKLDGCPLILIYRAGHIDRFNDLVRRWRQRARDVKLGEIKVLSVLNYHRDSYNVDSLDIDGVVEFHPFYPLRTSPAIRGAVTRRGANTIISYPDLLLDHRTAARYHKRQFPGACPSWDNTPRHRDGGATIFTGTTASLFKRELLFQFGRISEQTPYLFINAWNEWAEGCMLEPDLRSGKERLRAVKDALDEWSASK
ncbi:MAG: glycoside hydrolase family 99-like domain-containing protein [Spirochaetales bacterium]|nr:glycoside hydrolase family 99-like domain-containing protein [Spirochaetales bacterium]